jgi:tetratricopeptide (TPR) repeat protein
MSDTTRRLTLLLLTLSLVAAGPAAAGDPAPGAPASATTPTATAAPRTSAPSDPAWAAYAHYRVGLEARRHGDALTAIREFQNAVRLQPQWADPHYSLAWSQLSSDPGDAPAELMQGLRLSAGSFQGQYLSLFHALTWGLLAMWLAALALALTALLLAMPDLHHRLGEFFGRYLDPSYATVVAALACALPFALGLGVVLPTLFLLALLQPSLSGLGRRAWAMLLVVTLALPWLVREADSLLLPRTPASWVGRVQLAERSAWSPALDASLKEAEAQAPGRYEVPFARGSLELRARRLEDAVRDFMRADSLTHGEARVLNNLAVAEWMRGHADQAEAALRSAIQADDRLTAPHYNLAQVLSRKLAFEEANKEMLRAGALDFDRLRRHFNAYGAGQAGMMQEGLSPEALWKLWREESNLRSDWMEPPRWLDRAWESRPLPFALLALLTLAVGLVAGRRMGHWLTIYRCANCGVTVCRRCSGRRRGETYCQVCVGHLGVSDGGSFARVLLERRRERLVRERGVATLVLRMLLPPVGQALAGRWAEALLSWLVVALLALVTLSKGALIHSGPDFTAGAGSVPRTLGLALLWLAWWLPAAARQWRAHREEQHLELEARPPELKRAA